MSPETAPTYARNSDVTGAGDGQDVSVPTHQRVHEYDGAFECLDCGAQWGALPGNPKEPFHCTPTKGGEPVLSVDAEYIRVLKDAFDIIQADANTEENYASMRRIGAVLGKLKAGQEQGND